MVYLENYAKIQGTNGALNVFLDVAQTRIHDHLKSGEMSGIVETKWQIYKSSGTGIPTKPHDWDPVGNGKKILRSAKT